MLEDKDIERIIDANKHVFATKEDLAVFTDTLREDFSNLLSSVDAYAKRADDYFQEMVMLAHKIDRHEKWIQQLADKLDVKLEY